MIDKKSLLGLFIIAFICLFIGLIYIHSNLKNGDFEDRVINILDLENKSDLDKIYILMNFSYNQEKLFCPEKSFLFESLLDKVNIKNEHVVLICGSDCSHATSRVFFNNSWIYPDSTYNIIYSEEDYINNGFFMGLRHINCIGKNCDNYNVFEKYFYFNFYVKYIWNK